MADLACETPSNAAQFIAQLWQRGGERLARLSAQLDREMRDQFARALQRADASAETLVRAWDRGVARRRERLAKLERRLLTQNPSQRAARRVTQLQVALQRLDHARERYFSARGNALALAGSRLASSDPLKPLERGYAIVLREGRALRDARETSPGDEIEAKLFHGSLTARVETVKTDGR